VLFRGKRRGAELEGAEAGGLAVEGEGVEFVGVAVVEDAEATGMSVEDIFKRRLVFFFSVKLFFLFTIVISI
jgi:hypothetical protein